MAWEFVDAKLVNSRVAKVKLKDNDNDPATEDATKIMTFTKDNNQTIVAFRAMVRREVIAELARLNTVDSEIDISDDVRP